MAKRRARAKSAPADVRAKRRNETHLQWRSRLAHLDRADRDRNQPLVSAETAAHGSYVDEYIMHVESQTVAKTVRHHMDSPIERLNPSPQQLAAATEIQRVIEKLSCAVSIRSSRFEARVDNFNAAHDPLIERLSAVRLEAAYTAWRDSLSQPRMILDMVMTTASLKATAQLYRVPWRRARQLLIDALDAWEDAKSRAWGRVGEGDVNRVYGRLGCGELVDPPSARGAPSQPMQQLAA